MKKITLLAAVAATAASFANADTVLGVYAGYGSWDSSFDGKTGEPSITLKDLGVKDEKNNFFYIALEHPIPLLPNIRLAHTEISNTQTATINKSFTFDGTTYPVNDTIKSEFDLTHTDATLYYEILDNWVNLDLGLTARQFDGFVYAQSTKVTTRNKKEKVDQTLPMLYGKVQFDLPFSGLSAGIEGNYVSYSGDKISDYSAKVSYLFDSVLDIGLEAGYRKLSLTIDEDELQANVDLKGPYAAVIAHF
ncbi:MAG: TIGR04219 family outer membrane beta-barrel protein [Cellvibrio sp.]